MRGVWRSPDFFTQPSMQCAVRVVCTGKAPSPREPSPKPGPRPAPTVSRKTLARLQRTVEDILEVRHSLDASHVKQLWNIATLLDELQLQRLEHGDPGDDDGYLADSDEE